MEAPKPTKKHRVRGFIKRNRKAVTKGIAIVMVLGLTAGVAYNAGVKQGSVNPKGKVAVSAPSLEKLKEAAKNSAKKSTDPTKKTTPSATSNSSGFFRLAGTIQTVKKESITIKLGDGSVVTLAISDKAKFYTASPRTAKPITDLKAGTSAFVIGTVGPNGTFTASNIQAQK